MAGPDPAAAKTARVPLTRAWPLLRRFWPWVRPEKRTTVAVALLKLIALPAGIVSPLLVKRIFDDVLPQRDRDALLATGLVIVGITLTAHLLRATSALLVVRMRNRVRHRLVLHLFDHVLRLPLAWFHRTETGYVMARVREDVEALDAVMTDALVEAAIDLVRAIVFFGLLLWVDLGLATSGLVLIALVFGGVVSVSGALRRRSERAQEADAEFSGALHQSVTGVAAVRTAARERGERRRFGGFLRGAVRTALRRDLLQIGVSYSIGLSVSLGTYVILTVGAYRILAGDSTVGSLFAFSIYLTYVAGAVTSLLALNPALQRGLASLQRIYALLDEPREPSGAVAPPARLRGAVEFDRVSFSYGDDLPALHDVTLAAAPGEVIALVGRSGAGKSTLASLIPRLHDPTAGEVRIDGRPARDYDLRKLRAQIGVVPQDVFLFNRTIRENIAYAAPGASEERIRAAAVAAHADEFVRRLPQGYDTLVGERGVRLSGGEKQRIAIAREILRDPPILVLDEATSSLDVESEALIRDAIERLKRDRTCFVIAHRLSTIVGADRIVVLDRGRVVEVGTHRELLARGGVYRRLHEVQAVGEELGAEAG